MIGAPFAHRGVRAPDLGWRREARAARRPNGAGSPGLEVQRLADAGTFVGLTAAYYALTYVGFAAPCVVSLAAHVASYAALSSRSRSG
jgi:hypothetical protein